MGLGGGVGASMGTGTRFATPSRNLVLHSFWFRYVMVHTVSL
jgi:hypothetical protein